MLDVCTAFEALLWRYPIMYANSTVTFNTINTQAQTAATISVNNG